MGPNFSTDEIRALIENLRIRVGRVAKTIYTLICARTAPCIFGGMVVGSFVTTVVLRRNAAAASPTWRPARDSGSASRR
jgi:hypothetical protein